CHRLGPQRDRCYHRNAYYHRFLERRPSELGPRGSTVLELGAATGYLLHALRPGRGLGIDISERMGEVARAKHPGLEFQVADAEGFELEEKFDFVIASDLIGELGDITATLECVQRVCDESTQLILTFHSPT